MKSLRFLSCLAVFLCTLFAGSVAGAKGAQPLELNIQMVPGFWINGVNGAVNIEYTTNVDKISGWTPLSRVLTTNNPYFYADATATNAPKRFYRAVVENSGSTNAPTGMSLIPAGSFTMGDTFNDGWSVELPTRTVSVSGFYIDKYEVTKALWDSVYVWAVAHGYSFDNSGLGKAANHPVYNISWYDGAKWCNARSEREGRSPAYYTSASLTTVYRTGRVDLDNDWVKWNVGYRLPTEAEWEKAARGGASGHRFPWSNGDTITHSQANYFSTNSYAYDTSPTRGYHPSYDSAPYPYTSPVGSFVPNGYGLYDMAGNVWEWCWDWYGSYSSGSPTDPHGLTLTSVRALRGGCSYDDADGCRVAGRGRTGPSTRTGYNSILGFRSVLPSGQP